MSKDSKQLKKYHPIQDLPEEYGPWQTVYKGFALWAKPSVWDKRLAALAKSARA